MLFLLQFLTVNPSLFYKLTPRTLHLTTNEAPPVQAQNLGSSHRNHALPPWRKPRDPPCIASLAEVWRCKHGAGWALAPFSQILGAGGELGITRHFSTAGRTAA